MLTGQVRFRLVFYTGQNGHESERKKNNVRVTIDDLGCVVIDGFETLIDLCVSEGQQRELLHDVVGAFELLRFEEFDVDVDIEQSVERVDGTIEVILCG